MFTVPVDKDRPVWRIGLMLIAASNSAHASVISLNRDRPATPMGSAFIGIIVVPSVTTLTIAGSADVHSNTARTNVHTLSGRRCWSGTNQCTSDSKRENFPDRLLETRA
jgi:hypothetical protein